MDASKRAAKEDFVRGHSGAPILDVELVVLLAAVESALLCFFLRDDVAAACVESCYLREGVQLTRPHILSQCAYAGWRSFAVHLPAPSSSPIQHLLIEFAILILPLLLAITYTSSTWPVITLLLVLFATGLSVPSATTDGQLGRKKTPQTSSKPPPLGFRPFSVAFRASLQLVTIAAILAVDFRVFPRPFAKTESFGTSLMDLGVGAFMFSNGFVAGPRLKRMPTIEAGVQNLMKSLRISVPVLIIGGLRTVLTKGVNYQEHVTEYGLHWNFFYTLGLIPVFTAFIQLVIPYVHFGVLGGVVIICYQEVLKHGLEDFILNAPREGSLFQLNREGVCSFLGYWSIFLIAAYIGERILGAKPESETLDTTTVHIVNLLELASIFGVVSVLFVATRYRSGIEVSRRMANMSYVLWVLASMLFFLIMSVFVDFVVEFRHGLAAHRDGAIPIILSSVNKNQLAVFLLANILTGLVNLSIDTLSVSDPLAFGILTIYLAVVCFAAVWFRRYRLNFNGPSGSTGKPRIVARKDLQALKTKVKTK
ncbi:GWT1-domain-containing protein [Zopfochytrium polystomum]|nr:GWT1-domain-containing protein [Zopfochytrium polystomum]